MDHNKSIFRNLLKLIQIGMKLIFKKIKAILCLKINITVEDLKMFMEKLLLKHKLNTENRTFSKYTPHILSQSDYTHFPAVRSRTGSSQGSSCGAFDPLAPFIE